MSLIKKIKGIPTIESENIILRKIEEKDAVDLFKYYNNEQVYKHLDWNGPDSVEGAKKIIQIWNKGFEQGWIIRFAIAEKISDRIIGTIFLNEFEGKRAEVGYELSEDYWRQGIMSEAMKKILDFGFIELDLIRIQALVCEENIACKHLLEKFNFLKEGYLRQYEYHSVSGKCKDMYLYSLLKEEHILKR